MKKAIDRSTYCRSRTSIDTVEKKRDVEDIVMPLFEGSRIKYPPAIRAFPGADTVTVAMVPISELSWTSLVRCVYVTSLELVHSKE